MEEDRTGYVTGAGAGTGNATATGMPICLYLCIRNNINCNEFWISLSVSPAVEALDSGSLENVAKRNAVAVDEARYEYGSQAAWPGWMWTLGEAQEFQFPVPLFAYKL